MFFEHEIKWKGEEKANFSKAEFLCDFPNGYLKTRFNELKKLSRGTLEVKEFCIVKNSDLDGENYKVTIGEKTVIEASTVSGALCALADIKDIAGDNGGIASCVFADKPNCEFRAYRTYLPSYTHLEDFYKVCDLIADLKYNTIILEIGGAMEYERHPEITEDWRAHVADMRSHSCRTLEFKYDFPWEKNSTHADNAEGEILTHAQLKEICVNLRDRGLRVIPEVPTLSHSDYIVRPHRDLAERDNDPFPDTYCPSDPRIYDIVFDILDEVIEVMEPDAINIGHDEYYSMAVCDRCKGKDPVDLYVGDIIKIHDYLAKKGVRTIMWGEKLLNAYRGDEPIGGAGVDRINEHGLHTYVPPLYKCAEKLPRDIFMLNWYWEFGAHLDEAYISNGYKFAYGNLYGSSHLDKWKERLAGGTLGGAVSNWGSFNKEAMQRNMQNTSLFTYSYILCSKTYDSDQIDALTERVAEYMYKRYLSSLGDNPIEIENYTEEYRKHVYFFDGVFPTEEDDYGKYEVTFEDGTKAYLPVRYGVNVSAKNIKFGSDDYLQMLGTTYPVKVEGGFTFRTAFSNPYPEKVINDIKFVPKKEEKVCFKQQ